MIGISKLQLEKEEKRTFILHVAYSIIDGIIRGVLVLNEFVFITSLNGTNYQLGFLFQESVIVFLLLVFLNDFIRRNPNKRKLIRITGILTRAPLLLLIIFPTSLQEAVANPFFHYVFLAIFMVYFLSTPIVFPIINLFLKSCYRHERFGLLYSYSTSLNKAVMLITTFLYGFILDRDNFAFTYVLPILAVMGVASFYFLSMIKYEEPPITEEYPGFLPSIKKSIKNMYAILRDNKPYRDMEIGFMFYGFAFMTTMAVVTIYFKEVLELNYSSFAFYRNFANLIAIFLIPYFGKLIGKIQPGKYAMFTFSTLLFYLFFIAITDYFPYHFEILGVKIYITLIASFLSYSLFIATMALLWSIGSAYFCKKEEAVEYQSVHLSMIGVRAVFAPLLGVFFYNLVGFQATFGIGIAFIFAAVVYMWWSLRSTK